MNNMKYFLGILCFFIASFSFAQDKPLVVEKLVEDEKIDFNQIFTKVDVPAEPIGGLHDFRRKIASRFRVPEFDKTVMGRVIAKFKVCDDGTICDVQIVTENPVGIGLGEEAIRTINLSGNWLPATKNEKTVSSYYVLPISVMITGDEETPEASRKKE